MRFAVPGLGIDKPVWFLVDTGATASSINEAETVLMGIDYTTFPETEESAVGFGGQFKPRIVNKQLKLIFTATDGSEYCVRQGSFLITVTPEYQCPSCGSKLIDEKTRKEIADLTPNVLGMDILRRFHVHIDKKTLELTIR